MDYMSQKGQDQWVVEEVFQFQKEGWFIDLGASDGVRINNTYLLEKELDWRGVCIEPNPIFFSALQRNRGCTCIDAVVDEESGRKVPFRIDNMELGGIVAADTDNSMQMRGKQIREGTVIVRETTSLFDLLEQIGAPKVIDYLSLDVEGAETRILRSFPFDQYLFLAITIERPTVELEKVLFSNGYEFVMKSKKMEFDSYYIHSTTPRFNELTRETYSPTPAKNW